MTSETSPVLRRAGVVAVVGRANVGKSTLINRICEEKVSIVSPVAQTTRNLIRAVVTEPRGQLVLLDTPGVHQAVRDLGRLMNRAARAAVAGVDVVLLVLDGVAAPRPEDEGWLRRLLFHPAPVIALLNKADQGATQAPAYRQCWAAVAAEKKADKPVIWLSASALSGAGVPELVSRLFALLPVGPPLFPDDVLTDYPRKLAMADVVREQYFLVLRDELPHALAVSIEAIAEQPGGWQVAGTVYVDKPSQKPMVIGAKAWLLKRVRRAAEQELSAMYATPVKLDLRVKVEKNWSRNFWLLKQFGYAP